MLLTSRRELFGIKGAGGLLENFLEMGFIFASDRGGFYHFTYQLLLVTSKNIVPKRSYRYSLVKNQRLCVIIVLSEMGL